jgi:hypothetical protein
MAAINYQFIPTPTATVQGAAKIPRHISSIFTVIIGRMRITGWQLHKTDICTQCEISESTLQRALKWLVAHGYMAYDLIKKWQVFPVPVLPVKTTSKAKAAATQKVSIDATSSTTSPVICDTPSPVICDTPYKESLLGRKNNNQSAVIAPISTPPMVKIPVVVSLEKDDLIYPAELSAEQKIIVKSIIKKVNVPEMAHEVLFALAYAITNGNIQSSLGGYVTRLVVAANEGRLTRAKSTAILTANNRSVEQTQIKLALDRNIERSSAIVVKAGVAGLRAALRV